MLSSDISVVIPAYNAVEFIRDTIASALAQSIAPCEVVVVDDASTDSTALVVKAIRSSTTIPVRLLRLDANCGGPAKPLNIGIRASTGKWIATLDHDDIMLPTKLEHQMECIARCPDVGVVIGRVSRVGSTMQGSQVVVRAMGVLDRLPREALGGPFYRIKAVDAYEALVAYGCYPLSCSNLLFSKAVFEECAGFDPTLVANCDYGFVQKAMRTRDVGFVDELLLQWHAREESLHQVSGALARSVETLEVLKRFDRRYLRKGGLRTLRDRLRTELLDCAYLCREMGCYGRATATYWESMRHIGPSRQAIVGLAKLVPHWALRRWHRQERRPCV